MYTRESLISQKCQRQRERPAEGQSIRAEEPSDDTLSLYARTRPSVASFKPLTDGPVFLTELWNEDELNYE